MKRDTQIKLSKLVGMLGSDHDNEILAAVGKIKALLKTEKLSIPDLQRLVLEGRIIVQHGQANGKAEEAPWEGTDEIHRNGQSAKNKYDTKVNQNIAEMSTIIIRNAGNRLSMTQRKFVQQMGMLAMTRPHFEMTPRQAEWFADLFAKYS